MAKKSFVGRMACLPNKAPGTAPAGPRPHPIQHHGATPPISIEAGLRSHQLSTICELLGDAVSIEISIGVHICLGRRGVRLHMCDSTHCWARTACCTWVSWPQSADSFVEAVKVVDS
jgi:hypothetical protein